jgi:hypothetical protein
MRPPSHLELVCLSALLVGSRVSRGVQETRSEQRIAPFMEAAYAAYDGGRPAEANRALSQLADVLKREDADWTGTSYGKWLAWELCLTYGRLGLLASGTSEESKEFALARPWCGASPHAELTDAAKLRATLAEIDDNADGSAKESGGGGRSRTGE